MIRHINDLKQQIERILNWEKSSHWRPRDFVHLSELMFTHTNRRVDAQELQVFWQSSVVSSHAFLDVLACFADYSDWDEFCSRNFYGTVKADDELVLLHQPMWEIPVKWVVLICWLSVVASILVAILLVLNR